MLLDHLDPPKPRSRQCACGLDLDTQPNALVEHGEFDYFVCRGCGVASVWRGDEPIMTDDTYDEGFDG